MATALSRTVTYEDYVTSTLDRYLDSTRDKIDGPFLDSNILNWVNQKGVKRVEVGGNLNTGSVMIGKNDTVKRLQKGQKTKLKIPDVLTRYFYDFRMSMGNVVLPKDLLASNIGSLAQRPIVDDAIDQCFDTMREDAAKALIQGAAADDDGNPAVDGMKQIFLDSGTAGLLNPSTNGMSHWAAQAVAATDFATPTTGDAKKKMLSLWTKLKKVGAMTDVIFMDYSVMENMELVFGDSEQPFYNTGSIGADSKKNLFVGFSGIFYKGIPCMGDNFMTTADTGTAGYQFWVDSRSFFILVKQGMDMSKDGPHDLLPAEMAAKAWGVYFNFSPVCKSRRRQGLLTGGTTDL